MAENRISPTYFLRHHNDWSPALGNFAMASIIRPAVSLAALAASVDTLAGSTP
jgi:hypothetical protein